MGIEAGIMLFGILAGAVTGSVAAKRTAKAVRNAAQVQAQAVKSLAPPPGPTASEIEIKQAKEAADKRAEEREEAIRVQTAADVATKRRSLTGLAATVRTSPFGLTGTAPTEKKTLLGEGGFR